MEYQKKPVNVPGWEMYQVDTDGNIYAKNGKILKYSLNQGGYCIVNFYNSHIRKGFAVHTLVALTFIPNEDLNKNQVNHKDGIKTNNSVSNLEWVSPLENTQHAIQVLGHNKISSNNPCARAIQGFDKKTGELKYDFPCIADAAKYFVKENKNYRYIQNIICEIAKNKPGRKSYRGCIWRYKE